MSVRSSHSTGPTVAAGELALPPSAHNSDLDVSEIDQLRVGILGPSTSRLHTPCSPLSESEVSPLRMWMSEEDYRDANLFDYLALMALHSNNTSDHCECSTEEVTYSIGRVRKVRQASVFHHLKMAWEMGLLIRQGPPRKSHGTGSKWFLTDDGKRFLLTGLRVRLKLMETSTFSRHQISEMVRGEEVRDWESELRDRSRSVASARTKRRRRQNSKLTDGQPKASPFAVTRTELAHAVESQVIEQVRTKGSEISPIWAGLLR